MDLGQQKEPPSLEMNLKLSGNKRLLLYRSLSLWINERKDGRSENRKENMIRKERKAIWRPPMRDKRQRSTRNRGPERKWKISRFIPSFLFVSRLTVKPLKPAPVNVLVHDQRIRNKYIKYHLRSSSIWQYNIFHNLMQAWQECGMVRKLMNYLQEEFGEERNYWCINIIMVVCWDPIIKLLGHLSHGCCVCCLLCATRNLKFFGFLVGGGSGHHCFFLLVVVFRRRGMVLWVRISFTTAWN